MISQQEMLQQIIDFFSNIFSTRYWPARWHCGKWTDFHGWLYIVSELMIWLAYFAIPMLLFRMISRRADLPFPKVFWLFIAFILLCGSTHLMDALIFWWPAYRLSVLLKLATGIVSWFAVYMLYKVLPLILNLRTAAQLEIEIEQRKKAEEQVRIQLQEHEKTKEMLRVKDEFITLASHELKTPITSLRGYLQIMESMQHPADLQKHRQFVLRANVQAMKLTTLINDLFQASKIQVGQVALNISQFNFIELLSETLDAFYVIRDNDISLQGPENAVLVADKDKIGQVLRNLIDNALKYSPDTKKVIIKVEANLQEVTVKIQDFGIGIAEDKLHHIFDRYYRVENTSQNYSGMGLGLYISSEIIKRHGGKIGVESKIHEGSLFWFTLPLFAKKE